eukprot:4814915-Alexandrium_andersonii.AAC.1
MTWPICERASLSFVSSMISSSSHLSVPVPPQAPPIARRPSVEASGSAKSVWGPPPKSWRKTPGCPAQLAPA